MKITKKLTAIMVMVGGVVGVLSIEIAYFSKLAFQIISIDLGIAAIIVGYIMYKRNS